MLPPEFRDGIQVSDSGDSRIVLTSFDGCIVGYPLEEWNTLENQLNSIRNPNKTIRNFLRLFIGSAMETPVDKQGRILVPPALRKYAKLDKEVMLVGVGKKFELWNADVFNDVTDVEVDDVSASLDACGAEISF